jgi:ubiquinone/menaquinone biosynthesis C-methylase UbiE
MQKRLKDKGWIETSEIIKSEIRQGMALELGHGPGYLGLEWLKHTQGTVLKGLDISPDMIEMAKRNAKQYGLTERVQYIQSSGDEMPFEDYFFNAVFTNGSLHEWAEPRKTFNEIWRVLKHGGRLFISDLRRDMFPLVNWFLWINTEPKEIRPGLITSINSAYTPEELKELIRGTMLSQCKVRSNLIGLKIVGMK